MTSHQSPQSNRLGRGSLLWVVTGLTMAVLPVASTLPIWVTLAFLGSGVWRIYNEASGRPLPSGPVRLTLFVIALIGVVLSVGGPLSSDSGVSYLVILTALKFLELRTPRDFVLIASLGYFLLLSGFFFSESLASTVYSLLAVSVLTTGVVRLTMGPPSAIRGGEEIRQTLWMILQAAPIALILFLLFPRMQSLQFQLFRQEKGKTGMNDEVRPGAFSQLAMTREEAFRVEFDEGNIPDFSAMYWRGVVLWEPMDDGFSWRQGVKSTVPQPLPRKGSRTVWQTITLDPHRQRWLFAMDHPIALEGMGEFVAGGILESKNEVRKRIRYRVLSEYGGRFDSQDFGRRMKEPSRVDPGVRALAEEWKSGDAKPDEIVRRGLLFFREGFRYTLEPGDYRSGGLREFLLERRKGFCEHYAAAFASLMRIAGVPAVVVLGYQGGEINRVGRFVTVRQSDAHAWTEVYLGPDRGWVRIDPTTVVAPDRVAFGMDPFAQIGDAASRAERLDRISDAVEPKGLAGFLQHLRYNWDAVSYQWDLAVLSYDGEMQSLVYHFVGLQPNSSAVWIVMLIFLALVLGLMSWLMKQPRRRGRSGTLSVLYRQFCDFLAKRGVNRESWEGPVAFGERAAQRLPSVAEPIRVVARQFAEARYGRDMDGAVQKVEAERTIRAQLRKLRKELARSAG